MTPIQQTRELIDPPSEAAEWHGCDSNNKKSIESDPIDSKQILSQKHGPESVKIGVT